MAGVHANAPTVRVPVLIAVLTAGTFLMGTTEFIVAGLLPELASAFGTSIAQAGLSITAFAVGMIVGPPVMALLTLRLPRRLTLALALLVFALGHVIVAVTGSFGVLLAARFVTAVATGAFWATASVVASKASGPTASSRALGLVLGGGMLANVIGVPLGAFAGQAIGWRGPFWVLAALAVVAAGAVIRFVPHDVRDGAGPTMRAELRSLRSGRLWLTLLTCAGVTGGVLSIYSFISPMLTDRSGLPTWMVPIALMLFGAAALAGSILGGRLGDRHPFGIPLSFAAVTMIASGGMLAIPAPVPALVLFTLLGLVGLSANPVLVSLIVRYGGDANTLPSSMSPSMFNLGTAVGTAITGAALQSPLGASAPPLVGTGFAALVFVPLVTLAIGEHRSARRATADMSEAVAVTDADASRGFEHRESRNPEHAESQKFERVESLCAQ
jgi:DHA1 family inner membrane transport protein